MYHATMVKTKESIHQNCFFQSNELCSDNIFDDLGNLTARFFCHKQYQGYTGRMHGGILAALIDSAMTRCLFGHGIVAYTIRLNIKYSHPVEIDKFAEIKVSIKEKRQRIILLEANICQNGKKRVTADSQFWIEEQ